MIQRNLMIPNYSMIPAIWWSPAIRWSIRSMDFDNRKVYGDTSITDGLVIFLNLVLVFCWIGSLVPFQNRTWVVQPPPDEQRQCRLPGQIEVLSWSARFSWKQFPWLKKSQTSGTKVLHPCLIDEGRQGGCRWGTLNMMWIISKHSIFIDRQ